jgi:hypothetical protein
MIKGDPMEFAVESRVSKAFPQRSLMALGSFVIHVAGRTYGVLSPTATMLACSFDSVKRRIDRRGRHKAFFAQDKADDIVRQYVSAYFGDADNVDARVLGFNVKRFCSAIEGGELVMAPDGDAAFDDGSHVLHFDMGEHVRVIAFKNEIDECMRLQSISEVTLDAAIFYVTLQDWANSFSTEWRARLADASL